MVAPKKILLLIAGPPGTGKTYLGDMIEKEMGHFINVNLDQIKENNYDKHGFDNLKEKKAIDNQSLRDYFEAIEKAMITGEHILTDYPFGYKQKPVLEILVEKYDYYPITIRLYADDDVLYERQRKRDLDPTRHLGHLMTHYHHGDVLSDRSKADGMPSREIFKDRIKIRGYNTFQLGRLFTEDVNDFSKVDYTGLLKELKQLFANKELKNDK